MNDINDIQRIINFGILRVLEAKRFGIPKGQVSPSYKGCQGISGRTIYKRSSSLEFYFLRPLVGDSANTSSVCRSGDRVLFSTIRHLFYPGRQTPLESQSTNGEGEFVLRKL